jgi:hypothetical protein
VCIIKIFVRWISISQKSFHSFWSTMAIVFIIDTAPSMGCEDCPITSRERSPCISRLDCAKACVESFLRRHRQHPPQFLLVTTSTTNALVNVGWVSVRHSFSTAITLYSRTLTSISINSHIRSFFCLYLAVVYC